jgi:hypothetical protein
MDLLRRINVFWFGAGSFLTLFAANEIVAFRTMKVARWLGGPVALGGEIVALLVGLTVIYTLGIEDLPEEEPETSAVRDAKDDVDDDGGDEDEDEDEDAEKDDADGTGASTASDLGRRALADRLDGILRARPTFLDAMG